MEVASYVVGALATVIGGFGGVLVFGHGCTFGVGLVCVSGCLYFLAAGFFVQDKARTNKKLRWFAVSFTVFGCVFSVGMFTVIKGCNCAESIANNGVKPIQSDATPTPCLQEPENFSDEDALMPLPMLEWRPQCPETLQASDEPRQPPEITNDDAVSADAPDAPRVDDCGEELPETIGELQPIPANFTQKPTSHRLR
jgi:hypothetical protein